MTVGAGFCAVPGARTRIQAAASIASGVSDPKISLPLAKDGLGTPITFEMFFPIARSSPNNSKKSLSCSIDAASEGRSAALTPSVLAAILSAASSDNIAIVFITFAFYQNHELQPGPHNERELLLCRARG